jgi:hypothetical protein
MAPQEVGGAFNTLGGDIHPHLAQAHDSAPQLY